MSRPVCVLVAAFCLVALSTPAIAQQPLQPVTKWDLDYAETQCAAYRDYGSKEDPITLAIRPSPNAETYEILVARQSRAPAYAEELQGSVDFGRGPIKAWLLRYGSSAKKLDIFQFRIRVRNGAKLVLHDP